MKFVLQFKTKKNVDDYDNLYDSLKEIFKLQLFHGEYNWQSYIIIEINSLDELKSRAEHIKNTIHDTRYTIYGFSSIMRIPDYNSNEEEKFSCIS